MPSIQTLRLAAQPLLAVMFTILIPTGAPAADQPPPGAGSILQQIQPPSPPAPSSSTTGLTIEPAGPLGLPPSAVFKVERIELSGNTVFDAATLHALVADAEGRELTLPQLGESAARISDYYHRHGYPLARALIPAQTIHAGVIHVQIIEARYGKIQLENGSRVRDSLAQSTLSSLQPGEPVEQHRLDHALLLLSDIPGAAVSATLRPGEAVGTSDLQVQTGKTPGLTGSAALDNYGNRYTGITRLIGSLSVIDPLHDGDVLSLTALTSGENLNYGSLSYDSLLNGAGTHLGGMYSALHYKLGDHLESLDGHGTAQVASLWVKTPIVRSRDANLYGELQYDHKRLDDLIGSADLRTDRHLDNVTASLNGDLRRTARWGSVSTWNVGLTYGRVGFDDASAARVDARTADVQGRFSKWTGNFLHLQTLSTTNSLYFNVSGQWTDGNLDSAEKMVAGGPYTVRAYDMGVESGDTGILGTGEFRHDFPALPSGQLQAVAFVDSERTTINHTPWTTGTNAVTLSGTGLGLNWAGARQWHGRIYVAAPIGHTPEIVGDNKSVHAWLELGKGF